MGYRSYVGIGLIKLSRWLRYLSIIILPPKEIVNLAKIYYRKKAAKDCNEDIIGSGLNKFEEEVLEKDLRERGKILILGCGTGRESIALAKLGFDVVGVDMVEESIRKAKENSAKEGLLIDFVCDEFSSLSFPKGFFDYAFFSLWTYEQIPTVKRRVKIIRYLRDILKSGGKVILHFHLSNIPLVEKRLYLFHKIIAWITFGNKGYQLGDRPVDPIGFTHKFTAKEEVHNELVKAGFSSIELTVFNNGWGGYAVATP